MSAPDLPPDVARLAGDAVGAIKEYTKRAVAPTIAELDMLSSLNKIASKNYGTLADRADKVCTTVQRMQEQHAALAPIMKSIDELGESLQSLEKASTLLDAYTRDIELAVRDLLH